MPTQTRWGTVAALLIAGVIAALQIGKASIALPALQRELMLTLTIASVSYTHLTLPTNREV